MTYRSPVADILFSLKHVAGLDEAIAAGLFGDLDPDTAASVIAEAGQFAHRGDRAARPDRRSRVGARYENGVVTIAAGLSRRLSGNGRRAGWSGVTAAPEDGGMGLPHSVNFACSEIWTGASMGFALCPLLTKARSARSTRMASDELRETYLTQASSAANGPAR